MYQINTLYTINLNNKCQLYFNKSWVKVYMKYSRNTSDKFFKIPGKMNRYGDIILTNYQHFRIKKKKKKDT